MFPVDLINIPYSRAAPGLCGRGADPGVQGAKPLAGGPRGRAVVIRMLSVSQIPLKSTIKIINCI